MRVVRAALVAVLAVGVTLTSGANPATAAACVGSSICAADALLIAEINGAMGSAAATTVVPAATSAAGVSVGSTVAASAAAALGLAGFAGGLLDFGVDYTPPTGPVGPDLVPTHWFCQFGSCQPGATVPSAGATITVARMPGYRSDGAGGVKLDVNSGTAPSPGEWNSIVQVNAICESAAGQRETRGLGNVGNSTWAPSVYPVSTFDVSGSSCSGNFQYYDHLEVLGRGASGAYDQGPVRFYPDGHPDAGGGQSADQRVQGVVTLSCLGAGGALTSVTGTSVAAVTAPGSSLTLPDVVCPDGTVAGGLEIGIKNGAVLTPLSSTSSPAWVTSVPEQYPDCAPPASCRLDLVRTPALTGAAEASCFTAAGALVDVCRRWALDPDRATNYSCRWGPYPAPLARCGTYATPSTGQRPTATADGEPLPPDTALPPAPDLAEEEATQCPPPFSLSTLATGYWVYKGVSCALAEAFVPSPATQTQVQQLGLDLVGKAPAAEVIAVMTWLTPPPSLGSSCLSFDLPLTWVIGQDIPILHTCDADDPVVKLLGPLRPLLTVVVWLTILAPLAWWFWREYAPGSKGVA